VRTDLIAVGSKPEGDAIVPLLREEMAGGPDLATRAAAAAALCARGDEEALPAMIQEWRNLAGKDVPVNGAFGKSDACGPLIGFLIFCRDERGIGRWRRG